MDYSNYSNLSKDDKSVIFDTVNAIYLKLKGYEKHSLKKSFVHVWKINKTVGCFDLMMALYHSIETLDKAQTLVTDDINSGHVRHDWETQTVPWRRYRGVCLNLHEEIEELENRLEGGKGYLSTEEHYEEMKDLRHQLKQEYEDTIRSLEKQIARHEFSKEKEIRSANLETKRLHLLLKQEKALQEIKKAGIDTPC